MTRMGRMTRAAFAGGAMVVMMGCATQFRNHGYVPTDDQLAEVLVGVDTRDTVIDVVGPPTAGGATTNGGIFYVQSRFRLLGPLEPKEIDRQVVAITFDSAGVVENVERFGLENGNVVPLSRRVTEGSVQNGTFLRQLFGSIGNVNAGDFIGDGS